MSTRLVPLLLVMAGLACDVGTDPDVETLWSVTQFGGTTGDIYADEDLVVSGAAFSNRLFAVDRGTGAVRWQRALPLPVSAFESGQLSPTLHIERYGDLLIVASDWVFGIERATGVIRWSFTPADDRPGRWVIVEGDQLYAGSRLIYSLRPATGEVFDAFDVGQYVFEPILDGGVLYFGGRVPGPAQNGIVPLGAGYAMAVDAEFGAVIWQQPIPDHPTRPFQGGVVGRGALTPEVFVVAGQNARVYAFDRATGAEAWTYEGESPYNAQVALVGDVAVVGGTSGSVEAIDLSTGLQRWSRSDVSSISRMGQTQGLALPANGRVRAFDAAGIEAWGFGGVGWGQPTIAMTPVVLDGVLFANSVENGRYAVRLPR